MRKREMEELGRPGLEEYKKAQKIPMVVVLDNIRSLQNVGSVFRTADAYLIEKIYLCGITAVPPHREIHRAALGATESVSWAYVQETTDILSSLRNQGFLIAGVEQSTPSISLRDFVQLPAQKTAIILGNEVNGISDEAMPLLDVCLELPQFGTKHSLNVSVCAGIVIWELFHWLKKTS
jgi:tRNA G18 (ribose-2'-O)-methylase SpoU